MKSERAKKYLDKYCDHTGCIAKKLSNSPSRRPRSGCGQKRLTPSNRPANIKMVAEKPIGNAILSNVRILNYSYKNLPRNEKRKNKRVYKRYMANLPAEMPDSAKWNIRLALNHAAGLAERETEGRMREKAHKIIKEMMEGVFKAICPKYSRRI